MGTPTKGNWEDKFTAAYIRDKEFAWLPVDIIRKSDKEAKVKLALPDDWYEVTYNAYHPSLQKSCDDETSTDVFRLVKLSDYQGGVLPLRNVDDEGKEISKTDLGDLAFLHEAAILYNIRRCHAEAIPYTRVNDIVISTNPFHWINGLYSKQKQQDYAKKYVWNVKDVENKRVLAKMQSSYFRKIVDDQPHIYETSCKAYRGMIVEQKNQTILVSGVSGAGKTEAVKKIMDQLATMYETRDSQDVIGVDSSYATQLKQRVDTILVSNPIFESFGNAKTKKNDNSSRFGKFTKLIFDINEEQNGNEGQSKIPLSYLVGSTFQTYLLEKSRVVAHLPGERSFHIFYQLLNAPEDDKIEIWNHLSGKKLEDFAYLGNSATSLDVEDAPLWEDTKEALKIYGVVGDNFLTLIRAVCIVLQLGNLKFTSNNGNDDASVIASTGELAVLSELMGISSEEIEKVLTSRTVKTRNEEILANHNPSEARESRDALAKLIYSQLFDILVEKMNETSEDIHKSKGISRSISLLDLFGFESFEKNCFEQFCINYANEQLQRVYVLDNFYIVQEEYMKEGIPVCDFSDVDNTRVIDLIQGRMGIIAILNDECLRPQGNDSSFVYKTKALHKKSGFLVSKPLHRPTEFGIEHFAGVVTYDATNFVKKNTDVISKDILFCASNCTNEFVRDSFKQNLKERIALENRPGRKKIITTCSKFKSQLNDLIISISTSQSRFIRCIKPNEHKEKFIMEQASTMKQLSSSGLVTAINISSQSYPNSLTYKTVWERFNCLLRRREIDVTMDEKAKAEYILVKFLGETGRNNEKIDPYACGKTKIFFSSGSLETLEMERMNLYNKNATIIQSWIRSVIGISKFKFIRAGFILLQANVRATVTQKLYDRKKSSTIVIQCAYRCFLARGVLHKHKFNRAAMNIQIRWRYYQFRQKCNKYKKAALVIERMWLSSKNKSSFASSLALIVEQAQKDKQLKHLQKEIAGLDESSDKYDILKQCSLMMGYLASELYNERGRSSNLKSELGNLSEKSQGLRTDVGTLSEVSAATKFQLVILRKENLKLKSRIEAQNRTILEKKASMKELSSQSALETVDLTNEIERISTLHKQEIIDLKKLEEENKKKCCTEKKILTDEIELLKDQHNNEMDKLNLLFKKTQEDHEKDLSRMLEALETTQNLSSKVSSMDEKEMSDLKEKHNTLIRNYRDDVNDLKHLVNLSCSKCEKKRLKSFPEGYEFSPRSSLFYD